MLITVRCNECDVEFEIARDDDRSRTGRTYCEAHSVLRNVCPIWGQPNPRCVTVGPGPFFVTGVKHVCGR
jgi:hypothetical protein